MLYSLKTIVKMTSAAQQNKGSITVKGSADIICEYLDFSINSILFQRGIYPPETFKNREIYGVPLLMSEDNQIKDFLRTTLQQLNEWIIKEVVNKVALVLTNVRTKEVMERWDFKVQYEGKYSGSDGDKTSDKPIKQVRNEIRDVLKQIASSVSYLPLLDCLCDFDLLFYIKEDTDINLPSDWADTTPATIKNAQLVNYRTFSTNIHKVETAVVYKTDE